MGGWCRTLLLGDPRSVCVTGTDIRKLRKPDVYKAKGIRYAGEVIRKKVGKTGAK